MVRVGVVLSGCGVYDGSEIHEAVLSMLCLDQQGAEILCMAPDMETSVVNHLTGKESPGEKRNVLVEAARIARGKIRDIADVKQEEVDALMFPGGFGAAKNLCSFASDGPSCKVHPDVARLAKEVHQAGKPIGAVCIAPALIAKIFEGSGPLTLTIGNDPGTAQALEKMGQEHHNCPCSGFVLDSKNKVVTSPAYMLGKRISEVAEGIGKTVEALLKMAR